MNHVSAKSWLLLVALPLAAGMGCDLGPPAGENTPPPKASTGPPPIATEPVMVQENASVDLTKKGQAAAKLEPGVISTPARAYLRVPDRVILDNITYAVKLYKAEHGDFPKSQEQFMQDIIAFNQIKLPELPQNSKYVYNPATGELMIEHPQ